MCVWEGEEGQERGRGWEAIVGLPGINFVYCALRRCLAGASKQSTLDRQVSDNCSPFYPPSKTHTFGTPRFLASKKRRKKEEEKKKAASSCSTNQIPVKLHVVC